ncbi:cytochrome o ubiquinol oxidase subunit III, partial [Burkholderia pseudomallei]
TDCVNFAALFAVAAVIAHEFACGPTAVELYDIPGDALETALLLVSSITYGFALLGAQRGRRGALFGCLAVTFVLGAAVLSL